MASAIDPTKPADGVPASKADLRANLLAAKTEIEALQLAGDSVLDWVNPLDFGAVGDGSNDDTAALQATIDTGLPIYLPANKAFQISAPLTVAKTFRLEGAIAEEGGLKSEIRGNFNGPLIRMAGNHNHFVYNPSERNWKFQDTVSPTGSSRVLARNVRFRNTNINGTCLMLRNVYGQSGFYNCKFSFSMGGLFLLQSFDCVVQNCQFDGNHFLGRTFADGHWTKAYGLYVGGHTLVIGNSFQGCGTAFICCGPGITWFSNRFEVNGRGVQLGVLASEGGSLSTDVPFATAPWHGLAGGNTWESNRQGLRSAVVTVGARVISPWITGSAAGAPENNFEYGIEVLGGTNVLHAPNAVTSGSYSTGPIVGVGYPDSIDLGDAAGLRYDHTTSGLSATNVQAAIDELKALIDAK